MKYLLTLSIFVTMLLANAQERVNPIIENFGGIYEIPEATVKPDPTTEYKIVIDVYGGAEDKTELDRSLNNVARMLNLHHVGGVPAANLKVVLALHGQSTYSTLDDATYKAQFGVANPNTQLIKELKEAGVKLTVCGQSIRSRGVDAGQLNQEIEVATSMLTTVTHYQMQGYLLLKF